MRDNYFYVTTPIYYVNDKPHIGHAYTTVLADVLTRYHKLFGERTHFLTGTDEHGQKVQKAAEQNHMTPIQQCDATVVRFQALWQRLEIGNDDFIRTTEERHKTVVRKVLQDLYDRGEIYKAEYEGRYCVPCERFFTEKDLLEGNLCPECKRATEPLIESNYFFKMSKYQEWLIDHIKSNPEFILPTYRANETLGFLKQPLGDLCISRPKNRLSWGIELPFDTDYVCYVWFDALINYISAIGYGADEKRFESWWPCSMHLIGKDILTTHTVYWPTMLKAMGVAMPKTIFAHGWWLTGQDKMSKSLGNVINPMEMCDKYGVDAFRYFLVSEMTLGQDASFTEPVFVTRYNSDLANDLGNLLSRVVKMIGKNFDGKIPVCGELETVDTEFRDEVLAAIPAMTQFVRDMRPDRGIEQVIAAVRAGNRYFDKTAPWTLAKEGNLTRLGTVLYTAAEALRILAGALWPVMPAKMTELRNALGISPDTAVSLEQLGIWGVLQSGTSINDTGALFQRVDVKAMNEALAAAPKKEKKTEKSEPVAEGVITIDDFFKAKLITAKVLTAEKIEGAEKLLKLQLDDGSGTPRQIVAGIAQFYAPETMPGRTVVIVSNLKPAKIRGVESNGMLLAAKHGGELKLVTVDGEMTPGASVG